MPDAIFDPAPAQWPDTAATFLQDEQSLAAMATQRDLALACLIRGDSTFDSVLTDTQTYERARRRSIELAEAALANLDGKSTFDRASLAGLLDQNLRGLDLEARIQHGLGALDAQALRLLTECVHASLDHQPLPERYEAGRLLLQGASERTVPGVVLLTTHGALAAPANVATTLLAWPRLPGGLRSFTSPDAARLFLEDALGLTIANATRVQRAGNGVFMAALLDLLAKAVGAFNAQPEAERSLEQLQWDLLDELALPPHWPRDHALGQVLANRDLLRLQNENLDWLSALSDATKTNVINQLAEHCQAQQEARLHTERELPTRLAFLRAQVNAALAASFEVQGRCQVTLRIPARLEQRLLPTLPGHSRQLPAYETVASAEQVAWPLEQMLLHNVDTEMRSKLPFMQVEVDAACHTYGERVRAGITPAWLVATAQRLNLAQAYEQRLLKHYQPSAAFDAPARQRLRRPLETALALHATLALARHQINEQDAAQVRNAIFAHDSTSWGTTRLHPVAFTLFDEAHESAPAQVQGALLLNNSDTGRAVLYLPGAPRHSLSGHASHADALAWLADQCLHPAMRDYLAQRAISGDPHWLAARIDQALASGFRQLFQSRIAWPAERSMAQQLLNEQTGRLLRLHRDSSRSNGDLLEQSVALSRQQVVDGIWIALGFTPVVGTAIDIGAGLYGLYNGVRYFQSGDVSSGAAEIQMAVVAFLGAVVDLLPAGAALSSPASHAVQRAQRASSLAQLDLRRLASLTARADQPFDGYAIASPALPPLPGDQGRFHGIYSMGEAHYIQRKGLAYAVQWDQPLGSWRLRRPGRHFPEQAIALSPEGQWESHGTLYGQLIHGGLNGGGNLLARTRHALLPLWLRRYLPERVLAQLEDELQHFQRLSNDYTEAAQHLYGVTEHAKLQRAADANYAPSLAELQTLEAAAQRLYDASDVYYPLVDRVRRGHTRLSLRNPTAAADQVAYQMAFGKYHAMAYMRKQQLKLFNAMDEHIDAYQRSWQQLAELARRYNETVRQGNADETLFSRWDTLKAEALVHRQHHREHAMLILQLNGKLRDELPILRKTVESGRRQAVERVDERVSPKPAQGAARRELLSGIDELISELGGGGTERLHIALLADCLFVEDLMLPRWSALRKLTNAAMQRLQQTLKDMDSIGEHALTVRQRERIVLRIDDDLTQFQRFMLSAVEQHPNVVDASVVRRLNRSLDRAKHALPALPAPTRHSQRQRPRPLHWDADTGWYFIEHRNGQEHRLPLATPDTAPQRSRPRPRPAQPVAESQANTSLATLREQGQAYLAKVAETLESGQRMLAASTVTPADIDDHHSTLGRLLGYVAEQLQTSSNDADQSLVQRIRSQSQLLIAEGRRLHARLAADPERPSVANLGWLLRERLASLDHAGPRKALSGQDFLEEYAVMYDGQVLWYVHFHFPARRTPLVDFAKAHLKTVAQRMETGPGVQRADVPHGFVDDHLAAFTGAVA